MDKNDNLEIKVVECVSVNGGFVPFNPDIMDDIREVRIWQAGHLYFVLRRDGREIAKELGISKSLAYQEVNEYRKRYIRKIISDLKEHKALFGHMVGLLTQSDSRIRQIREKIDWLEEQASSLRQQLNKARGLSRKEELLRVITALEDRRFMCFTQLRKENVFQLQVFDRFGLCDADSVKIMIGENTDAAVAIENARATIIKLIEIIKFEVKDEQTRRNIFGRLANEIKIRSLEKRYD